jgi:hypothetical protein
LKKANRIWKAYSSHTYKNMKGGKYQSKTRGTTTMLRGKNNNIEGE